MLYVCVGDVMDVFCLNCEVCVDYKCSCMGSMSVLSYRFCMFMSCVNPMAVLNAAFCMTCRLLMLIEDARGDHMKEAYTRGPRRHSLHEVGLLQTFSQIVSTQSLLPEMGTRFRFWASWPSLPAAWLALLLTKVGDVESSPGPTTHTNKHLDL